MTTEPTPTSNKFTAAPNACSSCPYLRSTPPGVWDRTEYEKLPSFDQNPCMGPVFLCHQHAPADKALCVGWLAVHDIITTRLLVATKQLDGASMPPYDPKVYYSSGREACDAGLAGVDTPSWAAKLTVRKIVKQQRRRRRRT